MAIKKSNIELNLEFEDPKEQDKRKSRENAPAAVSGLEFAIGDEVVSEDAASNTVIRKIKDIMAGPTPLPYSKPTSPAANQAPVKPQAQILQHPASRPQAVAQAPVRAPVQVLSQAPAQSRSAVQGNVAEPGSNLREAIADSKSDIIMELYAEAKLLEYKVGQILDGLASTNPGIQKQVQVIKVLLAGHQAKIKKSK